MNFGMAKMKKNNNTGVLVIIQARMVSVRLPEKVIMELDKFPLIQHTIERAKKQLMLIKLY